MRAGSSLGFLILSVFSAEGGRGSVEAWYTSALDIEEVLIGATDSDVHLFVADVIKSFDTVDRRILDLVGFVILIFEYHAHVRLRFKLASGFGELWNRDGGIPQGVPFEHDVHCCIIFAMVSLFVCSGGSSASVVC